MSNKPFNDPMTLEELTDRVIELSERVARLEALIEEFKELREEIRRLDAKIDRLYWLWVSTIVAAFVLRLLRLV
jgi:phosphate uptake regulator